MSRALSSVRPLSGTTSPLRNCSIKTGRKPASRPPDSGLTGKNVSAASPPVPSPLAHRKTNTKKEVPRLPNPVSSRSFGQCHAGPAPAPVRKDVNPHGRRVQSQKWGRAPETALKKFPSGIPKQNLAARSNITKPGRPANHGVLQSFPKPHPPRAPSRSTENRRPPCAPVLLRILKGAQNRMQSTNSESQRVRASNDTKRPPLTPRPLCHRRTLRRSKKTPGQSPQYSRRSMAKPSRPNQKS